MNHEIVPPTPERLAKGDLIYRETERGGTEMSVTRRVLGGILFWYQSNDHITHLQARAGRRLQHLFMVGAMRSRYVTCRYSDMPGGEQEPEDIESLQKAYRKAREAIRGTKPQQIAFKVCCMGDAAGRHGELSYLKSALDDLIRHFGFEENPCVHPAG